MMAPRLPSTQKMHVPSMPREEGSVMSMASMSLVKREMRRPVGVVSKKAMGARTTASSRFSCSVREEEMPVREVVMTRVKEKMAVATPRAA